MTEKQLNALLRLFPEITIKEASELFPMNEFEIDFEIRRMEINKTAERIIDLDKKKKILGSF